MEGDPATSNRLRRRLDFDEFFEESFSRLLRTLFVIVGDRETARDLTQEAFIKMLSRWKRVEAYDDPYGWVRRVGVRLAMRRRSRDSKLADLLAQLPPPRPPQDLLLRTAIVEALADLSPSQRAVVAMHYFDDLPVAAIAETLDCAPSTVRVHLHRARTRLAVSLDEQELDDAH